MTGVADTLASAAARSRVVAAGWEAVAFRGATALLLLHALDDAFLNRQPGVPVGQHGLAAAVALAVGIGAMVGFTRLRPGLRAALALLFGLFGFTNGVLHVVHVALDGPAHSDLTGVVAAAAGAALVLLGLAIPFVRRGEGAASRGRRWANRVLAVAAAGVLGFVLVAPTVGGIVQTHKFREPIGAPPSAAYRPVTFRASDGLALQGWYVRSRNRAAVVLVHGGGGDRTGAVDQAELLARHGYGVLLYDSRGRGESEGSHNALGWGWEKDVAGALEFLERRPDVDPRGIGGLGLSTGADVLIEVAATDDRLGAVVADGATIASFADYRDVVGLDLAAPFTWTYVAAVRVLSGSSPPRPLKELVAEIAPTPLLLVSTGIGVGGELEANRVYAEAAREPAELWELPDVRHTAGVRERPQEYERRVVGLFDRALLDRG